MGSWATIQLCNSNKFTKQLKQAFAQCLQVVPINVTLGYAPLTSVLYTLKPKKSSENKSLVTPPESTSSSPINLTVTLGFRSSSSKHSNAL